MTEYTITADIVRELSRLTIYPWCGCTSDKISISAITGGLTNLLYCARYINVGYIRLFSVNFI